MDCCLIGLKIFQEQNELLLAIILKLTISPVKGSEKMVEKDGKNLLKMVIGWLLVIVFNNTTKKFSNLLNQKFRLNENKGKRISYYLV